MQILIPMAGEGSRFSKEGYQFPKPLIDVAGKPMIQRVVENLQFYNANYIFLVRSEHMRKYSGLMNTLYQITNKKCNIIEVDELTEGAACTALLARDLINNDQDLLIANSDQIVDYEKNNFMFLKNLKFIDGIVFAFNATHPKWSFVKVNSDGYVTEVAEKNPISNVATCGIYWYRKGADFVWCADLMIKNKLKTNNEYYIAPVYNELINDNKNIIPYYVNKMNGIGTPEDLKTYLNEVALK